MTNKLTEATFKDMLSPACSPELCQQLLSVLQEMQADRLSDLSVILNEESLMSKFLDKVAPKPAEETEDQALQRSLLRARARGELQRACDFLQGKRSPIEQVRGDYLEKATDRYGGFLSSNLMMSQDTITKVTADPGVYQELRVFPNGFEEPPVEDDSKAAKSEVSTPSTKGRAPKDLKELLTALLPLLVAIDIVTGGLQGALVSEYTVFLSHMAVVYGDQSALSLDRLYRKRLPSLAHKLAREEKVTYPAGVAKAFSKAAELCNADMVTMAALVNRSDANRGRPDRSEHDQKRRKIAPKGMCKYPGESCRALAKRQCPWPPRSHIWKNSKESAAKSANQKGVASK